jgi:hypothetical protein
MRSYFLRGFQKTAVFVGAALLVLLPFLPTPTHAQQSKTYSFTPTHAKNYTTTGNVSFTGASAATGWYSPDWKYRQKITINKDNIGEELTDFPVLVRLNKSITDAMRDDRYDLVVTASDGTTKLAHEREDATNIWVKVPKLTPTEDTVLYLYYGNLNVVTDQANPAQVWTNGYAGVWHLNGNPADAIRNSAQVDHAGATFGNPNANDMLKDGQVGKAYDFVGPDKGINAGGAGELNSIFSDGGTVSLWLNPRGTGTNSFGRIIDQYGSGIIFALRSQSGDFLNVALDRSFSDGLSAWNTSSTDSSYPVPLNKWSYVTLAYNENSPTNNPSLYVNGSQSPISAWALGAGTPYVETDRNLYIGNNSTAIRAFNGLMDNLHIATVIRSTTWIKAEYANQCDCEDFLTISDTVESQTPSSSLSGETASTIELKSDRPLSFSFLQSFTANAGGVTPTFQLSNDAGTSWLFYTKTGWKGANSKNPTHRSSGSDISAHLDTFPVGEGKLLWKAYLPSGTTLDQIQVGYTSIPSDSPSGRESTSLTDSFFPTTVQALNGLFKLAYDREPTFVDWTFWATRMLQENKPLDAWLGAMEWAARHN